jgi:transcriptional regulator with XRE-family HTH domain
MTADTTAAREAVAAEVRAATARKRASQSKIAKALGMSQQALSRRYTGEIAFDINELFGIAKYLDVPVSDLLPNDVDERSCMNSISLTFDPAEDSA